jgi:hypothetical protein
MAKLAIQAKRLAIDCSAAAYVFTCRSVAQSGDLNALILLSQVAGNAALLPLYAAALLKLPHLN